MADSEIIIDVTDAWVSGSTDIQAVEILELRGAPKFMLTPSDPHERERIAQLAGYCPRCNGQGSTPVPFGKEMRSAPCLRCKGKSKSLDHHDVRLALLRELCHGWEGWLTKSGGDVPFDEVRLAAISRDDLLSGLVLGYSQRLKKDVQEAEGKASTPGPAQP